MRTALSVLVMLALVLLIYLGMWRGWRARGQRQSDVPPLHPPTADADAASKALRTAEGRYFATMTAGDWMDRVVVHGLGVRSTCTLRLIPDGLQVLRDPHSFAVARPDLLGARRDRGTAGKVVPPYGVLVITWRHPGHAAGPDTEQRVLDSGFRLQHAEEHDAWVAAITALTSQPAGPTPGLEADR